MVKVYNSFSNTMVDSSVFSAAEKLVELRNTKGFWEVMDFIIEVWYKSHPKEWKSHLIDMRDLKETRKNKYASTKDKSLRYVLDIPEKIIMMIRKLYTTDECDMGKKWMLKFARRYPTFVVADRL